MNTNYCARHPPNIIPNAYFIVNIRSKKEEKKKICLTVVILTQKKALLFVTRTYGFFSPGTYFLLKICRKLGKILCTGFFTFLVLYVCNI